MALYAPISNGCISASIDNRTLGFTRNFFTRVSVIDAATSEKYLPSLSRGTLFCTKETSLSSLFAFGLDPRASKGSVEVVASEPSRAEDARLGPIHERARTSPSRGGNGRARGRVPNNEQPCPPGQFLSVNRLGRLSSIVSPRSSLSFSLSSLYLYPSFACARAREHASDFMTNANVGAIAVKYPPPPRVTRSHASCTAIQVRSISWF